MEERRTEIEGGVEDGGKWNGDKGWGRRWRRGGNLMVDEI